MIFGIGYIRQASDYPLAAAPSSPLHSTELRSCRFSRAGKFQKLNLAFVSRRMILAGELSIRTFPIIGLN